MKFDFHMHSVYSDGSSTAREIFEKAKDLDLKAIAVTDHDTVLGLEEIDKLSKEYAIPFIPAVEFTAVEKGVKFHVLGYNIDYKSQELIDYSKKLLDYLNNKSRKQIALMKADGIDIEEEEFFKLGQGGPLYRAKLLQTLANNKLIEDQEIMQLIKPYFGEAGPFFVDGDFDFYDFNRVVSLIKDNGGQVVLAHPEKLKKKDQDLYYAILDSGKLDGVEIYHPSNGKTVREELRKLAMEEKLLITGGSDYHGKYNKRGTQIAGIDIGQEVYDNLKAYFKNI